MNSPAKILKSYGFRKLNRIFDEATKTVIDVIAFERTDGAQGRIELSPSSYSEKRMLIGKLANADASLPTEESKLDELVAALKAAPPKSRKVFLRASGWSSDRTFFAVGRKVVGTAPEGAVPPGARKGPRAVVASRIARKGSSKAWKRKIAAIGRESSLIAFLISCGFAAPLLSGVSIGTICFVVFGRTRTGKSLATLAGASAVGFHRVGDMLTWAIKDARLEEVLPSLNDLMVPIEDLMTMSGTDSEKLRRIEELAYRMSAGRETERHSSFQTEARSWTALIVTQSEHGVSALAEKLGRQRAGGSAMRTIDVPALGVNDQDIFDLFKKRKGRQAEPEEREAFFKRIVDGATKHHGWPFIRYLEALIADDGALTAVEEAMAEFVATVSDEFDGDEARDLARKFGVVYAGGMRAIAYGVVDWRPKLLLRAITVCYRRARAMLKDDGQMLKEGLKRIRVALDGLPVLRSVTGGDDLPADAPGYRLAKEGQRRCVIKVVAFARTFASIEQRRLVQAWLIEHGRVTLAKAKKGGASKPKGQFQWPDGERHRAIEIVIPADAHI